jgi:hypothetical protein
MASTIIYKSNLIDATVVGSAFLFSARFWPYKNISLL